MKKKYYYKYLFSENIFSVYLTTTAFFCQLIDYFLLEKGRKKEGKKVLYYQLVRPASTKRRDCNHVFSLKLNVPGTVLPACTFSFNVEDLERPASTKRRDCNHVFSLCWTNKLVWP